MFAKVVVGCLLLISVVSCGGGGGSKTTSSQNTNVPSINPLPPTAPLDWDVSYFPTNVDLKWHYLFENGDTTYSTSSIFDANLIIADKQVNSLIHIPGGVEYYLSDSTGLYIFGFKTGVSIAGIGNFTVDTKFNEGVNLILGKSNSNIKGKGITFITPTYGKKEVEFQIDIKNFEDEEVRTPYGVEKTKHLKFFISASAEIENKKFTIVYDTELWLAENMGIVQRKESNTLVKLRKIEGPDSDGDRVPDIVDAFPADKLEQYDTDKDGLGNYADDDDDGDGVIDELDDAPLDDEIQVDKDHNGFDDRSNDADGDGLLNSVDLDDDNDGVLDTEDAFPINRNESIDTDMDGIGNNEDVDDDGDGVLDAEDAFPLDTNETTDLDGDGIGDNSDPDIDGDGVPNESDPFEFDPLEGADTDGDGIGDNEDTDDDGDGVLDYADPQPLTKNIAEKVFSTSEDFAVLNKNGSVVTPYYSFLSNQDIVSSYIVAPPMPLTDVATIYSNYYSFAALKNDGSIVTWGSSKYGGNMGNIDLSSGVIKVLTTGYRSFAVLKSDGSAYCWGIAKDCNYHSGLGVVSSGVKNIRVVGTEYLLEMQNGTLRTFYENSRRNDFLNNKTNIVEVYKLRSTINIKSSGEVQKFDGSIFWKRQDGVIVITKFVEDEVYNFEIPNSQNVTDVFTDNYILFVKMVDGKILRYRSGTADYDKNELVPVQFDIFDTEINNVLSTVTPLDLIKIVPFYNTSTNIGSGAYYADSVPKAYTGLDDSGHVISWGDYNFGADIAKIKFDSRVIEVLQTYCGFLAIMENGSIVSWGGIYETENHDDFGLDGKIIINNISVGIKKIESNKGYAEHFVVLLNDGSLVTFQAKKSDELSIGYEHLFNNIKDVGSSRTGFLAIKEDGSVFTWGGGKYGFSSNAQPFVSIIN
jgi:hypothetical protein